MSNSFAERFYGWREIFPYSTRQAILKYSPEENFYLNLIRSFLGKESSKFYGDTINMMLYMDVRGLLHNDMLTKVDRMSMANSLEVRVPFLDHSFVEYAFHLKGDTKLRGRTGKYILMETFREILPPSLHRRPKWGFEMPIGAWLRNELRFLIDEYLDRDRIEKQDIFNYEKISGQVRKSIGWMPWHQEPMKDVISCEKSRVGANSRQTGNVRMGKPGWEKPSRYIVNT